MGQSRGSAEPAVSAAMAVYRCTAFAGPGGGGRPIAERSRRGGVPARRSSRPRRAWPKTGADLPVTPVDVGGGRRCAARGGPAGGRSSARRPLAGSGAAETRRNKIGAAGIGMADNGGAENGGARIGAARIEAAGIATDEQIHYQFGALCRGFVSGGAGRRGSRISVAGVHDAQSSRRGGAGAGTMVWAGPRLSRRRRGFGWCRWRNGAALARTSLPGSGSDRRPLLNERTSECRGRQLTVRGKWFIDSGTHPSQSARQAYATGTG